MWLSRPEAPVPATVRPVNRAAWVRKALQILVATHGNAQLLPHEIAWILMFFFGSVFDLVLSYIERTYSAHLNGKGFLRQALYNLWKCWTPKPVLSKGWSSAVIARKRDAKWTSPIMYSWWIFPLWCKLRSVRPCSLRNARNFCRPQHATRSGRTGSHSRSCGTDPSAKNGLHLNAWCYKLNCSMWIIYVKRETPCVYASLSVHWLLRLLNKGRQAAD